MNTKLAILLLAASLTFPFSTAFGQQAKESKDKSLKPENAALVGKWLGTAKDGTQTIAEIRA